MLFIALFVAGCAGYFSVWGLSQLFAGASTAVIIMASVLEIGKIVTTTALHRYWDKIRIGLKTYLTISVLVLMLITSAGIYGFLSNAYQKTANKLEIHESEISIINDKKNIFQNNIAKNEKIIDVKNKRINQLSDLRLNQENRLDNATNNRAKDKVRNDIKIASIEIQNLSNEVDGLIVKNNIYSDSISIYSTKIFKLNENSGITSEIGPLKYISELTGKPMSKVVNFLILLLIFVFDPLAIALILLTNKVFEIEKNIPTSITRVIENKETEVIDEVVEKNDTENDLVKEDELIEEVISDEIVKEENIVEEPPIETPPVVIKKEPIVTTGKVKLEDIKEIKDRGYSVNVPQPNTSNTIERIGSNKVVKNGDNNKLFFKRGK